MNAFRNLLVDTNVWLDYYFRERRGNEDAERFMDAALEADCNLMYTQGTVRDTFYLSGRILKHRTGGDHLDQGTFDAIQHLAWGIVEHMQTIGTAVPYDAATDWLAARLKSIHNDFEDNLILATAELAPVDALVTNDKDLLVHSTVLACTPADALAWMEIGKTKR